MLSLDQPMFVERQWGDFLQFTLNEESTVKLLHVKKNRSISYQYHNNRSEQWYVIKGKVSAIREGFSEILLPGMMVTIDKGQKHRLEGLEDSLILEISKGYFDEKDIVRL